MVDVGYLLRNRLVKRDAPSSGAMEQADVAEVARPVERGVDFPKTQIALLFVVLAAIISFPILLHPVPPLSDYANHLARMHVISAIRTDPDLARFYEIDWQIIPNLMMDLIVPVFNRMMDIYAAGQTYTILSFVLIMSGTLVLNRQLYGHWSVLPLIAFPLLYNGIFLVGTMNYVFGIGLAIWALAGWIALRERAMLLRLGVSTVMVLMLFFCHLYSVGVYALGLFTYETYRLIRLQHRRPLRLLVHPGPSRRAPLLVDYVASGLSFLPVVPFLLVSPTWKLQWSYGWEFSGKIDGLVSVIEVYSHAVSFFLFAVVAFAIVCGIRHRVLRFHSFGWMLLAVGGAAYMALPGQLFETYLADQRLPIALSFMVVACADLDLRHVFVRRGFATLLVVLVGARVLEVQSTWGDLARTTASFRDSVLRVERGSKVLVSYAGLYSDALRDLGLRHAACLAAIERSALVTTVFSVVGKQILHVRAAYRGRVDTEDGMPPSVLQLLEAEEPSEGAAHHYWDNWTADYDYVYVLFTEPGYRNPDSRRLVPIYTGDRFVLYRVKPGVPATLASAGPQLPAGDRLAVAPPVSRSK